MDMARQPSIRPAWNTGRIIGPKPSLKPRHIWANVRFPAERRCQLMARVTVAQHASACSAEGVATSAIERRNAGDVPKEQEQIVTDRFERHRQPWTSEELQKLKLLAGKGMALKAISKAMTRSEESIKDRAKLDGIRIAKLR